MEEYVETLKEYLSGRRDYSKNLFKICATLYRGVTKGRFTYEEGMAKLDSLRGVANVNN